MKFPTLTDRDRRTVRLAAMGLGLYLVLFGGWRLFNAASQRRVEYRQLQREAAALRQKFDLYDSRVVRLRRLMESFQMDPSRLPTNTLVADASAALQQSAQQSGLQLGPIRETLNRGAEREVGSIRLEASGQVPALMAFLHRIRGLGFPLVMDSLQLNPEPMRPGMIRLSLNLILLNYGQWQETEGPRG
ncbi:MAG: hypothetical protein J0L84_10185 [Verrucomicrobia bacterium]|nr:hypothetical protein [Verrucomicrobiota bacterium]